MMDINKYFVRVYNDAIYIKMILMFLITYGFVFEVIQKLYSTHRNFKKTVLELKWLLRLSKCITIMGNNCDWILKNRPNCHTRSINFILLSQLMATLKHYTYTVPLPDLVDWSAF